MHIGGRAFENDSFTKRCVWLNRSSFAGLCLRGWGLRFHSEQWCRMRYPFCRLFSSVLSRWVEQSIYEYISVNMFYFSCSPRQKSAVGSYLLTLVSLLTCIVLSISLSMCFLVLVYLFCLFVYLSFSLSIIRSVSARGLRVVCKARTQHVPVTMHSAVMFPFLPSFRPPLHSSFLYCPVACCPAIFMRIKLIITKDEKSLSESLVISLRQQASNRHGVKHPTCPG